MEQQKNRKAFVKKFAFWSSVLYKLLLLMFALYIYAILIASSPQGFLFTLTYYTCQSNILIMVTLAVGILVEILYRKKPEKPGLYCIFQAIAAVNGMFLTIAYFLVYSNNGNYANLGDLAYHFLIPVLMFADVICFCGKTPLKFRHGFLTWIPILFYMFYALIFLIPQNIVHYPELIYKGMFRRAQSWWMLLLEAAAAMGIYLILLLCCKIKHKLFSVKCPEASGRDERN